MPIRQRAKLGGSNYVADIDTAFEKFDALRAAIARSQAGKKVANGDSNIPTWYVEAQTIMGELQSIHNRLRTYGEQAKKLRINGDGP